MVSRHAGRRRVCCLSVVCRGREKPFYNQESRKGQRAAVVMAALDRRVGQLIEAGTPEALTSAVALLRKSEDVGCATPETAAPENFLLVAEGSLEAHAQSGGDAMLKQARDCVEHFMRSRPAKSQFLSRAYFALGRVQASEDQR